MSRAMISTAAVATPSIFGLLARPTRHRRAIQALHEDRHHATSPPPGGRCRPLPASTAPTGRRGRPRRKGDRLPELIVLAAMTRYRWTPSRCAATPPRWSGRCWPSAACLTVVRYGALKDQHVTLVSVAHGFLTLQRLRRPKPAASA